MHGMVCVCVRYIKSDIAFCPVLSAGACGHQDDDDARRACAPDGGGGDSGGCVFVWCVRPRLSLFCSCDRVCAAACGRMACAKWSVRNVNIMSHYCFMTVHTHSLCVCMRVCVCWCVCAPCAHVCTQTMGVDGEGGARSERARGTVVGRAVRRWGIN